MTGVGDDPASDAVIQSPANQTLVLVRSLQRRAARATERAFVVEGRRAVDDALETGARPRLLLVREGDEHLVPRDATLAETRVRAVAPRLFNGLTDTVSPQGVLAIFPIPDVPAKTSGPFGALALVLDHVRDPGNMGTLLRAAAGAGVDAVYVTPASVDPFNPKAVRAGMGAHFRIPLGPLDDATTSALARNFSLRVVATASGETPYDRLDWRQPALLVVGSESDGVSADLARLGTVTAHVPLAAGVESLNAAVAGAVFLFEAARQRRA